MVKPILGAIEHAMDGSWHGGVFYAGTLLGTDGWFRNPASGASSTFGTAKDGTLFQWVDTDDAAWAQADGNPYYVSIENEAVASVWAQHPNPDPLTDAQLATNGKLIRWLHEAEGMVLQLADAPGAKGLGWHGMGGSSYGGHTACPGNPIKAQRVVILQLATGQTPPPPLPKGAAVFSPPLQVIALLGPSAGGGGWNLLLDGGVENVGNAPLRGSVFGQKYWEGHAAHHLDWPTSAAEKQQAQARGWGLNDCYVVVDDKGSRYGPVFA
jgi:hypothetical protein